MGFVIFFRFGFRRFVTVTRYNVIAFGVPNNIFLSVEQER